jgi:3-methyl-2-oxobutanoate hydroxymethyltransferase
MSEKVTLNSLRTMKRAGEKIACLTAYDASFAAQLDSAGVDILLVGDSLGMVLQGEDTTLKVTLRDMIYHSRHVCRGAERAMVVVDMPFMSYVNTAQAVGNAARLVSEGGAEVVKMEGGAWLADTVQELDARGIPVCAHLGVLPQSVHKLSGYPVQGRNQRTADAIRKDAIVLQDAGAALLVLECVTRSVAKEIARTLEIPVIGIGAGNNCDGQVLVLYDVLGISGRQPRFSRNFLESNATIQAAVEDYVRSVKSGEFPAPEHGFD